MEESLHFTILKFLKTSGTIIQRERDVCVCAFHRCGLGAILRGRRRAVRPHFGLREDHYAKHVKKESKKYVN